MGAEVGPLQNPRMSCVVSDVVKAAVSVAEATLSFPIVSGRSAMLTVYGWVWSD
jgi:hypothetical protein